MPIMCKDVGFRYTKDHAYLLTNLQITKQQNHGQMFLTLSAHFRDRKHRQSLFKRLGVKGPAPSLVMGNVAEIQDKVLSLIV